LIGRMRLAECGFFRMSDVVTVTSHPHPHPLPGYRESGPSRALILMLWLLAAVPLLAFLGSSPVQRTQEARVLETARQMLGKPARAWLLPKLNGEYRIRKPPLAYWMAAGSFRALGVNELSGRLPTAIA